MEKVHAFITPSFMRTLMSSYDTSVARSQAKADLSEKEKKKSGQSNRSVAAEISRSAGRSSVTSGAKTQETRLIFFLSRNKEEQERRRASRVGRETLKGGEFREPPSLFCSFQSFGDESSPAAALSQQLASPFRTAALVLC